MPRIDETVEDRLSRLGAETAGIVPRTDLVALVMQGVELNENDWARDVMRWARLGVAVASMAAAACAALAWSSGSSADHEEAANYGLSEVFE